jgi:ribonuclease VapC
LNNLVIDSSAFIAILANEPETEQLIGALNETDTVLVSAATLHESFCVAGREALVDGRRRLDRMVKLLAPRIQPFDEEQLAAARQAYARYGRGSRHSAGLNMGDCFAYALAKTRNLPLLFKGDDFIHTDIEPALKPA